MEQSKKVLAIISFICSLVGVLFSCFFGLGVIPGIAAIIMGIISRKKQEGAKGLAIAAIIIGAVAVLIGGTMLIISLVTGSAFISSFSRYLDAASAY